MKVNIYGIINPITKEIVYIGQTPSNLDYYIKTKYWKLNEVKRGKRNWNKLFHFLNNLLPIKAEITLLKICDTEKPFNDPDGFEKIYIKKYKELNPNLLNETDGGIEGNTHKYKSIDEKIAIGKKISKKLKGKKKPIGFADHLSFIRKGANNPMAIKRNIGIYYKNELVCKCNYAFEINEFFNKQIWSNIYKYIKCNCPYNYKGYIIKRII